MNILLIKKCLTIVGLCFIISIYAKCGDGIIRNSVGKEKRRSVKAFAASSVANLSGAENSNVCPALKGFEWSGGMPDNLGGNTELSVSSHVEGRAVFYFENNLIWKDLNLWNGQDLTNCVNLI